MSSVSPGLVSPHGSNVMSLQEHTDRVADDILASLARPEQLSADERRGIIARYSAVLEGNFIYWMTGAYLSVGSEEARSIILDNLLEEVRDCHPGMLRRFAMAAEAVPTDSDALAVYQELLNVRLFVGRLPRVAVVVMMSPRCSTCGALHRTAMDARPRPGYVRWWDLQGRRGIPVRDARQGRWAETCPGR